MQGGTGNDSYYVSASGDTVYELTGEGTDMVRTDLGFYTLGSNVENLVYIGAGNFIGLGNADDNLIAGGNANFEVTPDGRRFLVPVQPEVAAAPISLTLNWTGKLGEVK